jgi:hypothetical protein
MFGVSGDDRPAALGVIAFIHPRMGPNCDADWRNLPSATIAACACVAFNVGMMELFASVETAVVVGKLGRSALFSGTQDVTAFFVRCHRGGFGS